MDFWFVFWVCISVWGFFRTFKMGGISRQLSELKKDLEAQQKRLEGFTSLQKEIDLLHQKLDRILSSSYATPQNQETPSASSQTESASVLQTEIAAAEAIPSLSFTTTFEIPKDPHLFPPLQGEGQGGDGGLVLPVNSNPIPLPTSPLKGEGQHAEQLPATITSEDLPVLTQSDEASSRNNSAPPPPPPIPRAMPMPPPSHPPRPPKPPKPPRPRIEWERWIGVRGAALLGGIVLAIAALFLFKISIEKGFIQFTPLVRVVMGTLGGLFCLFFSEWARKKKYAQVPNALSGAGIVLLYTSFWSAKVLYSLVGMEITFVLMVLVTVLCGLLCTRHHSRFIAVLGLIGGFLTPLVLSTGQNRPIGLFSYVLLLDVAFLWVAQKERWKLISSMALIGTFIIQALWIFVKMENDQLSIALGVLVLFAAVFTWAGQKMKDPHQRSALSQQGFAILLPCLFGLYFAGNSNLGEHLYPIAGMMLLLSLLAIWIARAENQIHLVTAAVSATMTIIAIWLAAHHRLLTPALTWEILGVLGVFAILFGVAPQFVSEEKRKGWMTSQPIALLVPFVFALYLVVNSGSPHIYPVAGLLLILNFLCIFTTRSQAKTKILSVATALTMVVIGGWLLSNPLSFSALWECLGVIAVFTLIFTFSPKIVSEKEVTRKWVGSQMISLTVPYLFALYLAGAHVDGGHLLMHLYPLTGLLILLNLLSLWVARSQKQAFLLTVAVSSTFFVIGVWTLSVSALTPAISWEVLATLAGLASLYAISPRWASEDDQKNWLPPQSIGLVAPSLFILYFSGKSDFGPHFYPLFLLLFLLAFLSAWAKNRFSNTQLLSLSAAVSLLAPMLWFSRTLDASLVWESVGLISLLALFYHLQVERKSESSDTDGPAPAAILTTLGYFFTFVVAFQFSAVEVFWPWIVGWVLMAALNTRHASFSNREWLHFPTAILLGLGVGSSILRVVSAHVEGVPILSTYLLVPIGVAAAWQVLAVMRRTKPDWSFIEHSSAIYTVLILLFLTNPLLARGFSFLLMPLTTLALGVLIVLTATRLGQGLWFLGGMILTAAVQLTWTLSYQHLNFAPGWELQGLLLQLATVIFFTFWPFAAGKRFHNDRWAWISASLAGPLWFLSMKSLYLLKFSEQTIGILPVFLGILSFAAASQVRKLWTNDEPLRRSNLVWFLSVTLGFVSVAIPLQLHNEWWTIGWALEAFCLVLLWERLNHAGLKYFSLFLWMAVSARLLLNPEVYQYHPHEGMRILNWTLYTYWVPAAALVASALRLTKLEVARLRNWEAIFYTKKLPLFAIFCGFSAILIFFFWINLAIADWFDTTTYLSINFIRNPARDLTTSIAWALYALVLLGIGMYLEAKALRWLSLIFLMTTIFKVFLYDMQLQDFYFVLSLVGLAVTLILVSLAYQRFVFKKDSSVKIEGGEK